MKEFKDIITLNKNSRGCYILDTVKGCNVCAKEKPLGCYDNCYAKNIASRYGFNFSNPVKRDFDRVENQFCLFGLDDSIDSNNLIDNIRNIDMPFVRIGEMGDPSENWTHTIDVCKKIAIAGKPIVIITKHWQTIPNDLLDTLSNFNICINSSISALDSKQEIEHRLAQYNRLKPYCNSILRIVSCDFNLNNDEGMKRNYIQNTLLSNAKILETVFRPSSNNPLVTNKVINVKKMQFLRGKVLASVRNVNVYMGMCTDCPDMCGLLTK